MRLCVALLLLPTGALAQDEPEVPEPEAGPAEVVPEVNESAPAKQRRGGWVHEGFHHRIELNAGWGGFRLTGPGKDDWLQDNPGSAPYADGMVVQIVSRQGHGIGDNWTLGGYLSGSLGWNVNERPPGLALASFGVGAGISRYLSSQGMHFDFSIGPQFYFGRDGGDSITGTVLPGFGSTLGAVQDVWFSDHNAFGFGVRAELAYFTQDQLHVWMGGATLVLSILTTKRPLGKRGP